MAIKQGKLFLYLAIACFIGIVGIFIFAGYLGTYDTVYVASREFEQIIGPDFWNQSVRYPYPYSVGARWGEPVHFRYEIDNRRFSTYTATVDVSLWKSNEKLIDLFNKNISINSFDKATVGWTLSPEDLNRADLEAGQYTVKIKRGEVELGQGIILGFNLVEPGYPIKPIPAPLPR